MTRVVFSILLVCAALLPSNNGFSMAENDTETGVVVLCPIDGMVDDGMAVIVKRAVKEAAQTKALIFIIDTPGGLVDSAIEISNTILEAECRTIAYIKGMGAISAGALIAYSCDDMVMAPGTNIGASAPVMMGAEPSDEFNEKTKSFLRSRYRALGEEKGHPPLLGEAMVDAKVEILGYRDAEGRYRFVRGESRTSSREPEAPAAKDPAQQTVEKALETVGTQARDMVRRLLDSAPGEPAPEGTAPSDESAPEEAPPPSESLEVVSAAGELLTLTSDEALHFGVIKSKADNVDELLEQENLASARRIEIVPTWAEIIFRWLTSPIISSLLLLCGIGGIYMELKTPGFGIPGIIGLSCLALFFGSYLIIGLADWLDVLLVVTGTALIAVELFLLPGFGVVGSTGILCLAIGFYMTLTRVPIPQYDWDYVRLWDAGQILATTSALFLAFVIATWKVFPRTPFFRWLVLASEQQVDAGYVVQTEEDARMAVGLQGTATTMLRPSGRGRFEAKTYDVVTRGEYIEPGRPIEIIEVKGNRYVVKERTP